MTTICKGETKNKAPCKRKIYDKSGYCYHHLLVTKAEDDCVICYDKKVGKSDYLTCNHSVCKNCILQLRKLQCPICRKDLEGKLVTSKVKKLINENIEKDKNEAILNDRLYALEINESNESNRTDRGRDQLRVWYITQRLLGVL